MHCLRSIAIIALVSNTLVDTASAEPRTDEPEVVNLNEASTSQLQLLPGVGPALAQRIIASREKRRFRHTRQLRRVRGIGPRTYRRLRPHVTIDGPTTLQRKLR